MPERPEVVRSVAGLGRARGRLAFSVGVFDGLHLGHAHLLEALVRQSVDWRARPAVITFDAHPDAVLRGEAPPLLLDTAEREARMGDAGIEVIVVEHFDDELRTTTYDAFVRRIAGRVELAGFVMTPDAAFGYERRGTADALRDLASNSRPSFEVAVVPPFSIDGRPVSSSQIRRLVEAGDLAAAEELLGRPYSVVGTYDAQAAALRFPLPVALPATGDYAGEVGDRATRVRVGEGGSVVLDPPPTAGTGRLRVVFGGRRRLPKGSPAATIRRS